MKSILVAALGLSFACASTLSSVAPAGIAGSCVPATANGPATVYSRPDGNSERVAALPDHTQVCADSDVVGFGFRHVKLSNGKEGYVAESDLI
jgi:hypothetical protein